MENIAYYNGRIAPIEEMMVPMNDRVCYFGDGIYEATATKNRVPFLLSEHIDRFYRSAAMIDIPFTMEKATLKELLLSLVQKVDSPETTLYWQLTRGTGMRAHAYHSMESGPNLWVTVRPGTMKDLYQKYSLVTVPDVRYTMCHIKTLNLLPNILATQQAEAAGCHEAVFHRDGLVTECSHSNIHIIEKGVLRTAPLNNLILPGITRKTILDIAKSLNIPIREEAFTLEEMMAADEVFFTSASALCCSVYTIDGQAVGGRNQGLINSLKEAFLQKLRHDTGMVE